MVATEPRDIATEAAAGALWSVSELISQCTPEHQPTRETIELFRELRESFPVFGDEERREILGRLEALEGFVRQFQNSAAFQTIVRGAPRGDDRFPPPQPAQAPRRQRPPGPGFVGRQS